MFFFEMETHCSCQNQLSNHSLGAERWAKLFIANTSCLKPWQPASHIQNVSCGWPAGGTLLLTGHLVTFVIDRFKEYK